MPRFFFDIRDGSALVADDEGIELVDLQAAKTEAHHSLIDLVKETRPDGHDVNMSIEVRQADEIVFRAGFSLADVG